MRVHVWPAVIVLTFCSARLFAQGTPDDQARSLLEDGRVYSREGKTKQALDNFQTIVTGFSNTSVVDDALLEIGRHHLEVEKDGERARAAFEQVAQRFPQSDGAPGAYHFLGVMTLERATTTAELDDAVAQFDRVQRLYSRSEWVPRSLQMAAVAHRKAGRLNEALGAARRAVLEHPTSDAAPAAQFEVGQLLALMGEPRLAMEELQQVRNRHPAHPLAALALFRNTALFRLHGGKAPSFAFDPAFSMGAGDLVRDVRAILMTPARTLWIASEKTKSVVPLDADGKAGAGLPSEDVQSLSLTPGGDLVVAAARAIRVGPMDIRAFTIPTDKPGVTEPIEKIEAALVTRSGVVLVADEKKKRVYRFDERSKLLGTFLDGKERQVSRMTLDAEGAIVLLDRQARTVQVADEAGKVLRTIGPQGPGYSFRKPVDVATDAFRNLYVAEEEGGVLVFSPDGRLLTTVTSPELKKARAVALEPSGALLVYDEKSQRVLRYK